MANESGEAPAWVTIAGAILSLIAAVFVAIITIYGGMRIESIKSDTAQLTRDIEQQDIDLRKQIFEAEERSRTRAILTEWVPRLVSDQEPDQATARAVLFVLFPNDATRYVSLALESLTPGSLSKKEKDELIEQARQVDQMVGPWIIVIGTSTDLKGAESQAERAAQEDGTPSPVSIYQRDGKYVTTVGDSPNQTQAESIALGVRETIEQSAYVVDLSSWCPKPEEKASIDAGERQIVEYECEEPQSN